MLSSSIPIYSLLHAQERLNEEHGQHDSNGPSALAKLRFEAIPTSPGTLMDNDDNESNFNDANLRPSGPFSHPWTNDGLLMDSDSYPRTKEVAMTSAETGQRLSYPDTPTVHQLLPFFTKLKFSCRRLWNRIDKRYIGGVFFPSLLTLGFMAGIFPISCRAATTPLYIYASVVPTFLAAYLSMFMKLAGYSWVESKADRRFAISWIVLTVLCLYPSGFGGGYYWRQHCMAMDSNIIKSATDYALFIPDSVMIQLSDGHLYRVYSDLAYSDDQNVFVTPVLAPLWPSLNVTINNVASRPPVRMWVLSLDSLPSARTKWNSFSSASKNITYVRNIEPFTFTSAADRAQSQQGLTQFGAGAMQVEIIDSLSDWRSYVLFRAVLFLAVPSGVLISFIVYLILWLRFFRHCCCNGKVAAAMAAPAADGVHMELHAITPDGSGEGTKNVSTKISDVADAHYEYVLAKMQAERAVQAKRMKFMSMRAENISTVVNVASLKRNPHALQ